MKIGIIGGSGLDDPRLLQDYEEIEVETPYGKTSSSITKGKLGDVEVFIIARHGKNHEIPPTQVNYRANIFALAQQGCKHIIATTAVGSLRADIRRNDFVILDSFIDFTRHRKITFFDKFEDEPKHTAMAKPFSEFLRQKIIKSCDELKLSYHNKGTVVTIEGPRFSTIAESKMFRQWGADVINMSIAPEAILANEAGLDYAAIAMSTDYDCWKQDEEPVSWEQIVEVMVKNVDDVKKLIVHTISKLSGDEKLREDSEFIKSKIKTLPNWPKPGIMFRDINSLLRDTEGFQKTVEILENRYKNMEIDAIAGIESRGFILASILATKLNKPMILIRKPGKLPFEIEKQEYTLEYGTDAVEIQKDAIQEGQKVLLVDDLIATGGTAHAACQLIEKIGGKIVECAFVIDLPDLKGKEKLSKYSVFSIVEFEGE